MNAPAEYLGRNGGRNNNNANYTPIPSDKERARDALQYIPTGGHDERVRVACMLRSGLGEEGRDLWNDHCGDRGRDESNSVWKSAEPKTGGLTISTLFYEAKQNGWSGSGTYQKPSPAELAERKRIADEREAKEQAQIEAERLTTATKAASIWEAATTAREDHPYLVRKAVSPVATLREIDASAAVAILGYAPKSGGEPLTGRLLVVPVKKGSSISTLELIDGANLQGQARAVAIG